MKLPDVNVLVAASSDSHVHHAVAANWVGRERRFATCPVTELGLLRVLMQLGAAPKDADRALQGLVGRHRERLIPADLSATAIAGMALGHRQTTDLYLVELARSHKLVLTTLERSMARRFPEVCESLIPG
jgi:predicted nucleic acid-binding protein